jgi:hypothetical protein
VVIYQRYSANIQVYQAVITSYRWLLEGLAIFTELEFTFDTSLQAASRHWILLYQLCLAIKRGQQLDQENDLTEFLQTGLSGV